MRPATKHPSPPNHERPEYHISEPQAWICIKTQTSFCSPLRVVNPPKKPTITNGVTHPNPGVVTPQRSTQAHAAPKPKHPSKLTLRVPHHRPPNSVPSQAPNAQRLREPMAPPTITNNQVFIPVHILSHQNQPKPTLLFHTFKASQQLKLSKIFDTRYESLPREPMISPS